MSYWSCWEWTEAGSYLRLKDSCITQIQAQGPSRACNESKEEEDDLEDVGGADDVNGVDDAGYSRVAVQLVDPFCHERSFLNSRTTTWQKCEAVPKRARI